MDLMYLEEFYDYKNTLMKEILTDETLVDLISNGKCTLEDAKSLAYTQVVPCEYYPETIEDGKVYVCFDVDIQKVYNKTYYSPVLYIWVFVHKSLFRMPTSSGGGMRADKICSELDKKLNGSFKYGLGTLDLSSVKRFAPLEDYTGKVITYTAEDVNIAGTPLKSIPANRKNRS